MGVCTKERKGVTAEVLMATPCTNSLGGESGEHDDDVYYYIRWRLKLEGETENMCVWTKKRGSMNAVVLMATPCPKSLHGKGEKWIARNILQGLDSRQPMTAMTEKKSPG